jgi:putative molybdopterin biosynthesis protein
LWLSGKIVTIETIMESTLLTADDVAKLLRIKKYTVYELIKRGELPSSKVGKQVRILQPDIDCYLESRKTGGLPRKPFTGGVVTIVDAAKVEAPPGRAVILCGQDACLELFLNRIAMTGQPALRSFMGCYNGLYALYHGKVTMAAAHLWVGETNTYNYPFIRRLLPGLPVGVLRLAGRMQGLYTIKGNPLNIRGWEDYARPELTIINRERGCGTRILLDQKLVQLGIDSAGIQGYDRESSSHMACAGIVAKGGADLGCGCQRGAESIPGVEFIPQQMEWYDLVFRLADRKEPAVQAVLEYVKSPDFRQDLDLMGGYDLSQTARYEEF